MQNSTGIRQHMKMILISLVCLILCVPQISMAAVERPSAENIPLKSLIIGTYIIDFAAVSPTTVETAQTSADESGQDQVYYRSELTADGLWINITNASGVSDVLESSESIVTMRTIDQLKLTHWIKSDGATYEFGSDGRKTFSQMNPLSNPLVNEALDPLNTERDKQVAIWKNLDDDDDAYDIALSKTRIIDGLLDTRNVPSLLEQDTKVDAIEASAIALRSNPAIDPALIHKVDDVLEQASIDRKLAYKNFTLDELDAAGEAASLKDYSALADLIFTAYGKIAEEVRELEAQSSGSQEPATPLEEKAQEASEDLEEAILAGNIDAIEEAAEKAAVSERLALGIVGDSDLDKELLEDTLEDAQNAAIIAAMKGTSFDYNVAKAQNEAPALLAEMLAEETAAAQEALENWEDVMDMLIDTLDDPTEQTALREQHIEDLAALMDALPDTDMKPELTETFLEALGETQSDNAAAAAEENPVVQAMVESQEMKVTQLALLNEAYAEALENGDLEGANAIADSAESVISASEAEINEALSAYMDALDDVKAAEDVVTALLAASSDDVGAGESSGESGATDASGEGLGTQDSSQGTGTESGSDETETGTSGTDSADSSDPLTEAITELGDAKATLEAIEALLGPEDLQMIEAFTDLSDAIEQFGKSNDADMALASAEALGSLIPAMPDGFLANESILDTIADLENAMVQAKADAAVLGAFDKANTFDEAQKAMETSLETAKEVVKEAQAAVASAESAGGEVAGTSGVDGGVESGIEEAIESALEDTTDDGTSSDDSAGTAGDATAETGTSGEEGAETGTTGDDTAGSDASESGEDSSQTGTAADADGTATGDDAQDVGESGQDDTQDLPAEEKYAQEIAELEETSSDDSKQQAVFDLLRETVIIRADGFQTNGTTYIGIKSLFDQIDGQAIWLPEQMKAVGIANGNSLEIIIGDGIASISGEEVIMEAEALLVDGRAYLPFETISVYIDIFLNEKFDGMKVIIIPDLMGE